MRRCSHAAAIMLTALAAWSCGSDATGPDDVGCRIDRTTVFVGDGAIFDWSPGCAVAVLRVEDEMGAEMWAAYSPEHASGSPERANRIVPRVSYGYTPGGAGSPKLPVALVPGRNYKLTLRRVFAAEKRPSDCPPNDENSCLVAVQPFFTR